MLNLVKIGMGELVNQRRAAGPAGFTGFTHSEYYILDGRRRVPCVRMEGNTLTFTKNLRLEFKL
jgi:hypothetical protein